MSISWNDILQLPDTALAGDVRVPKTQIARQGNLSKAQEGMLGKLRDIRFFASLTKSSSYIQPVKNDAYDIESVIFLTCGLNPSKGASETLRMLHACFPNPTVILVEGCADSEISVSAAIRRKSMAEHGAFATEREATSGPFDPSSQEYALFLERLAYKELPQTTLLDYASAIADRCLAASAARTLGFYPRCPDSDVVRLMGLVKRLDLISSKARYVDSVRKAKDTPLSASTRLRVEMRKLEAERDAIAAEIREICNG